MNDFNDNNMENNSLDNQAYNKSVSYSKDTAKKASVVLAKKAIKALLVGIKLFLPVILVVGVILIVALIGYVVIYEFRGTEKTYSAYYDNNVTFADNAYYTTEENISFENKTVRDFYTYYSNISYWVKDGNELKSPDEVQIKDYYNREDIYKLNPMLLLSLDEFVFNDKFKYPDQFIKPVYSDIDSMKALPIADEKGNILAQSYVRNLDTGTKTNQKINSVADYGFGSIIEYNSKEDYQRIQKIKGRYVREDYWDEATKSVKTRIINEPFEIVMDGGVEDIDLIDRVVTFAGSIEYEYKISQNKIAGLSEGISTEENKSTKTYQYAIHYEPNCTTETLDDGTTKEVCSEPTAYPLYKYRSEDSMIVEELPVVSNTTVTQLNPEEYIYPYLSSFHVYVPENVIENFDIENRIDYSSSAFDISGILTDDYGFNFGSKINSEQFNNSLKYFDIIRQQASEFGVDPYIILAMMAQESGGRNVNSNGIMQITGSSPRTITAKNVNGEQVTLTLYPENKQNPSDSIRFATMYYKNLLEMYNNPYKALQAYNFGTGTMQKVKNANPEAWESQYGWLYYREAGRQAQKPGSKSASYGCINYPQPIPQSGSYFGDSCYVENVLRYYAGNNLEAISEANNVNSNENNVSTWDYLKNFGNLVSNLIVQRDDDVLGKVNEFNFTVNPSTIEDIFRLTEAFNQSETFSDVEMEDLSFFDTGFYSSSATIGIGYDQFINLIPNANGYIKPLASIEQITSPFGYRIHPIYGDWRLHTGIDIPKSSGTPIYAIADGLVEKATFNKYSGNFVSISHGDGVVSKYAHMLNYVVKQGDFVKQGQLIGFVGSTGDSTGPHLHFEIKKDNTFVDPTPLVLK